MSSPSIFWLISLVCSDMVRHVMHIYRVAGEDVLAIGTDFDGISGKLEIAHPSEIHLLREALAGAGLSESVLDKMWKGNALRVLRDTEVQICLEDRLLC